MLEASISAYDPRRTSTFARGEARDQGRRRTGTFAGFVKRCPTPSTWRELFRSAILFSIRGLPFLVQYEGGLSRHQSALRVRMFTSLCEIKQVIRRAKIPYKTSGFLKALQGAARASGGSGVLPPGVVEPRDETVIARGNREEGAAYPPTALQDMPRYASQQD
jgi:hypothetical protein